MSSWTNILVPSLSEPDGRLYSYDVNTSDSAPNGFGTEYSAFSIWQLLLGCEILSLYKLGARSPCTRRANEICNSFQHRSNATMVDGLQSVECPMFST